MVPLLPMLGAEAKVIVKEAWRQTPLAPGFGKRLVTEGGRGPSLGPPALPALLPPPEFTPALPPIAVEPASEPRVSPLPPALLFDPPVEGDPPALTPPAAERPPLSLADPPWAAPLAPGEPPVVALPASADPPAAGAAPGAPPPPHAANESATSPANSQPTRMPIRLCISGSLELSKPNRSIITVGREVARQSKRASAGARSFRCDGGSG